MRYFVRIGLNGPHQGPFTEDEIRRMYQSGTLDMWVCPEGAPNFVPVFTAFPAWTQSAFGTPSQPKKSEWTPGTIVIAVLFVIGLPSLLSYMAFGRKSPAAQSVVEQEPAPARTCRCEPQPAASGTWRFVGRYLDAACKRPIAERDFRWCEQVELSSPARVSKADGTIIQANVLQQFSSKKMFEKKGGVCSPATTDYKVTPPNCDGRYVCRNAAAQLACDGCRTLPNGCTDYEGSMAYIEFMAP